MRKNRAYSSGSANINHPLFYLNKGKLKNRMQNLIGDREQSITQSLISGQFISDEEEKREASVEQNVEVNFDANIEEKPKPKTQEISSREPSLPSVNQLKAIWKEQVDKARMVSGKLTEDEMLKGEGYIERLSGLVQERYAISRAEADKQVSAFLRKRHS